MTTTCGVGSKAPCLLKPEHIDYPGVNAKFLPNQKIHLVPVITGGTQTTCTVAPALPSGLALNPTTCVITGTVSSNMAHAEKTYVVTASNQAGQAST
jgi:hypothetical protein